MRYKYTLTKHKKKVDIYVTKISKSLVFSGVTEHALSYPIPTNNEKRPTARNFLNNNKCPMLQT